MAMNAGNFPNFNSVGRFTPNNKTNKPAPSGPKESPLVQQDPTESVQIGSQPLIEAKVDSFSADKQLADASTQAPMAAVTSSIPTQVGDFLIAGPGSIGQDNAMKTVSFDGLTALNGLNSTSLQGINGGTLASVNPLNPRSATRVPTTSLSALNGLESTSFVTTSGRVIG